MIKTTLMRIKLRSTEGVLGMSKLAGGEERRKTHLQVLGLRISNYSLFIVPALHIQIITICKKRRVREVKKTRALRFQPPIGHRHINPTKTRGRNEKHLNVVPTHEKGQFPSSALEEPDF